MVRFFCNYRQSVSCALLPIPVLIVQHEGMFSRTCTTAGTATPREGYYTDRPRAKDHLRAVAQEREDKRRGWRDRSSAASLCRVQGVCMKTCSVWVWICPAVVRALSTISHITRHVAAQYFTIILLKHMIRLEEYSCVSKMLCPRVSRRMRHVSCIVYTPLALGVVAWQLPDTDNR